MANIPKLDIKKFLPLIAILVVLLIVAGGVFYFKSTSIAAGTDKELNQIMAKVGKLMELPTGEKPNLMTVSDPAQLAGQPFFAKAQLGDKVLVYLQARQAIIYRPSTNKIITVGPVNVNTPAPTESAENSGVMQGEEEQNPEVQPEKKQIKIALYNGSTTSGLTNRFIADLSKKITNVALSVVVKQNANGQNYVKTQIIDLGSADQDVIRSLALSFNGVSGKLPEGEVEPEDADILVILGSDYAGAGKPTVAPTETLPE